MNKKNATAAHLCSACTSLVCMAQMGAMAAAGGAAMGAMSGASTGSLPLLTLAFQLGGLGFLLLLPQLFYQVLLIIVLAITLVLSYFSYKGHRNMGPFLLTVFGSLLLYSSIYSLASELLYWLAFVLMLFGAVWSYKVGAHRRVARVQPIAIK